MASNVSQFDLDSFAPSDPSICIPRVFANITPARVEAIFSNLDFGVIDKIDMVSKTNAKGEKFQRVFVHFSSWNSSEQAIKVRHDLLEMRNVKVVYDDPWFWKLCASTSIRPELRALRKKRPHPFVQFEPTPTITTQSLTQGC